MIAGAIAITGYASAAHACGVKLTGSAVNAPQRSAHPSKVHLVKSEGEVQQLKRTLMSAGHDVELVEDVAELEGNEKVVLTNQARVGQVQSKVSGGIVLSIQGTSRATVSKLEQALKRRASSLEARS
jgi:hypothetical protein